MFRNTCFQPDTYDKRRNLAWQTEAIQALHRIRRGIGEVRKNQIKMVLLMGLWMIVITAWAARYFIMGYEPDALLSPVFDVLAAVVLLPLAVTFTTIFLWFWGGSWKAGKVQDNLLRIGFVNAVGEPPALLSVTKHPGNPKIDQYTFYTCVLSVCPVKTVLLKVLFKGGADFNQWWQGQCTMGYDLDKTLEIWEFFEKEMERRKKLFDNTDYDDMDKYNDYNVMNRLCRMIFACDEVAVVLDKISKTKEQKEKIDRVIRTLSKLACQGRSFGLHIFIATQRPDANAIPALVRSNIDFRVCGRADSILSSIVIDSSAAAELIPKDAKGRFVLNDGSGKDLNATVWQ